MIDLHTHVLPAVDDGAASLRESMAMAQAAVADGVVCLAATPHVREDYPTAASTMERLVDRVSRAVEDAGLQLKVLRGGEIAIDRLDVLSTEELRRFGLGGNPRYLLIEFPYSGWPLALDRHVSRLRGDGFVPVLAHPERNRDVQAEPTRLDSLVHSGCLVQVTAASLDGRLGHAAATCARTLIHSGGAHLLGSDAHHPAVRKIGMAAAARAVGDEALARWLTVDVPRAIVESEPLPPRPAQPGRGLLARLLGR